jgi:pimeloyl-ACP methyl ester carboxylesterase
MITSNARADTPEKKKMRLLEADETLIVGSSTLAESMAPKLSKSTEIQRLTYQILKKTDPEGIANVQRAIAQRPNRLEVIKNLELPFLAVAGKDDQLMQPEAAYEMAEVSKSGKAVVLPGVGHMPMLEAPTALGALIVSML